MASGIFGVPGVGEFSWRAGRDCIVEAAEVSDDCPVLVGQIPLEVLDFVVDPVGQRLLGNPEHGGEQMIEMF